MKSKTKIFVVVNQKGGVGKSTIAFHLAHAGAQRGKKVLCGDLDTQSNLSQFLTGNLNIMGDTQGGIGTLFEGKRPSPIATTHPNIELLHGHRELDRYDDAVEEFGFGGGMREMLCDLGYDYVVLDAPPNLGPRQFAGLFCADVAVIPIEPTMSAILGLQEVLMLMDELIVPVNKRLRWIGVINRANPRSKSHTEKGQWLHEEYSKKILATFSLRTAVADAMEEEPSQPVWLRRGAPRDLRETWLTFCNKVLDS